MELNTKNNNIANFCTYFVTKILLAALFYLGIVSVREGFSFEENCHLQEQNANTKTSECGG